MLEWTNFENTTLKIKAENFLIKFLFIFAVHLATANRINVILFGS